MDEALFVAGRRLLSRRLLLRDAQLRDTDVFPMFHCDGEVVTLLLVWRPGRRLMLVDPSSQRFRYRRWRPLELEASLADLREAAEHELDAGPSLWHWDPDWALEDEIWLGHSAVPGLKETNAAHWMPYCGYSPDLLRVVDPKGQRRLMAQLPERKRTSMSSTTPWRLDPIWLRLGWPERAIRGASSRT